MEIKLTKVGDSSYVLVPSDLVNIFNLKKFIYEIDISNDGKILSYKRLRKDPDFVEEIKEEKSKKE
jgi:antitoxin component of MazEF toxin-antitoxin module